ncbi:hypothetical protein FB107DRAFT_280401 [Schizophyllum commune]
MTVVVAADDTTRRRLVHASRLALGPAHCPRCRSRLVSAIEIRLKLAHPDRRRQTQASCMPSPSQTVTANPAVVSSLSSLTVTHSYSPMATTSIAPLTRPRHQKPHLPVFPRRCDARRRRRPTDSCPVPRPPSYLLPVRAPYAPVKSTTASVIPSSFLVMTAAAFESISSLLATAATPPRVLSYQGDRGPMRDRCRSGELTRPNLSTPQWLAA